MTLRELREYFWWLLAGEVNEPGFPPSIDDVLLTSIINDGIRSLADAVRKIGYVSADVVAETEAITLPSDFVRPLRVKWGTDTDLTPIEDPYQAQIGSGEVTQYMIAELSVLHLYDTPSQAGTLYMWYVRYPTLLVNDDDVPTDIPPEYHSYLVTLYAMAQYFLKIGRLQEYGGYMNLWERAVREIRGAIEARVLPVRYDEATNWQW
jgi:hypothetical protein